MAFVCPKGHDSSNPDYCSECGSPIDSNGENTSNLNDDTDNGTSVCPDCKTLRDNEARFCEVCRYDFQNKISYTTTEMYETIKDNIEEDLGHKIPESNDVPVFDTKETTNDIPDNEIVMFVVPEKLDIVVKVDPSLIEEDEFKEKYPKDLTERIFPLDLSENLLGRRSVAKGIYPEIDIEDLGISHRHLKFLKQDNGSFSVLELGSSNGTELNGIGLKPGIVTTVKAGDEFVIGMWTRLVLRSRN